MVRRESEGGGEFHDVFARLHHGACEDVCEGVVGDAELLLNSGDDGRSGILGRALMGVPRVILLLAFEEHHEPRLDILNLDIGITASAVGNRLSSILLESHEVLLFGVVPDVTLDRNGRLRIHLGLDLISIFVVELPQVRRVFRDLVLARVDAIEVVAHDIRRILFSQRATLICHELPVSASSEIVCSHCMLIV